ncbi:MAG TPA: HlyD family efflux transporter periplasmic adaptor subunit [Streptosporangiaceae bacterium]
MGKQFRRIAVLSITGAVVAGGAGTAYAAMSSSGPAYRLASVTSANVTAALHVVGTLTPVQQADVAFSASGSVAAVAVKPGQHVTAGQTLGWLDTTSLKADLTAAQSTLANANLRVANDTASQNTATTTSATSAASQSASRSASPPTSSLRPLQQAVLSAQRQADGALAQAQTALGQAEQACASPPSPRPTTTPTVTATKTATATATKTATATATKTVTATVTATASPTDTGPTHPAPASAPAPATCADATQRVLDAETAALQAQQALSGRLAALNQALSRAAAAASTSSGGGGRGGGIGGGGSSGPAGPVSAAQLAADQASADAAAAQVTVAQQNIAEASVVSPISGTVVTVSVTPGSSTGAGSTAFVVAGLDSYQVVTAVPVTDMPQLKVGQRVSVQPDGVSTPLTGSVVSIGLMPITNVSPTSYAVTIGLTEQPSGLHAGGFANVTITTARGSGVSVPTSAVHNSGHVATVIVYAGGKTHVTRVTVGTKGPVMTRITSGLKIGQQVVLADLSQPLPTNNLTNQFSGPRGGPGLSWRTGVIIGPG